MTAPPAAQTDPATDLLLPEGTRLLHIGPAKTGTTSLQSGFHHNRDRLDEYGVHYAGRGTQPRAAAGAIATGKRIAGHRTGLEAWPRLVEEVTQSPAKRVVISSETFARAGDGGAKRVIDAFGPDRTHVVITMRPLADMLASSWQQYVQTGSTLTWQAWLDQMLNSPDTLRGKQPEFWRKTRIDALSARWGALVGRDNVTVLSLGGAPRDFVLRTFEAFTGLPSGTLVPDPGSENASLGYSVAETVRRFNELFYEQREVNMDLQARLVEFGAVRHLRTAPDVLGADERIEVPDWAAGRAAAIVREMTDGIREQGVRVVGDLAALERPSRPPVDASPAPTAVTTEATARLLIGMMVAARAEAPRLTTDGLRSQAIAALEGLTTKDLVTETAHRVRKRLTARIRPPKD